MEEKNIANAWISVDNAFCDEGEQKHQTMRNSANERSNNDDDGNDFIAKANEGEVRAYVLCFHVFAFWFIFDVC